MIISSLTFHENLAISQNLPDNNQDYLIKYKITGRTVVIGKAQSNIEGTVTIDTTLSSNQTMRHIMSYQASIPLTTYSGSAILDENVKDKIVTYFNTGDNIFGEIWNFFTNNSQLTIRSILRLTTSEIQSKSYHLLNETIAKSENSSIYSPDLGYRIPAYKIDIPDFGTQLYFDTDYFRMIGMSFSNVFKTQDSSVLVQVYLTVMTANFKLPSIGSSRIQELAYLLLGTIISLIIVIPLIINYRNKEKTVFGGLDRK